MKRSPNPAMAMPLEFVTYFGLIQGAGAAIPVVPAPPTSPRFGAITSVKGLMTAMNNYVSSTATFTRASAGVYTIVFKDTVPEILDIDCNCWGLDGKQVQIQDYNPQTLTLSFSVFSSAGAAVDLAATDFVHFTISGQFSVYP